MLDRRVAGDEVDYHTQPALVRGGDEAVEVLERAVAGIDRGVVGDVIAKSAFGEG